MTNIKIYLVTVKCLILFVLLTFVTAVVNIRSTYAVMKPAFSDLLITTRLFWQGVANTRIQCIIHCLDNVQCISLFYNDQTKQCHLHDVAYGSAENGVPEAGWHYYIVGDANVCPIDRGFIHIRVVGACHRLLVENGGHTWAQANIACSGLGGHLSKFDNDTERNILTTILNASNAYNTTYYFGAYKDGLGNTWTWRDGNPITLTNHWRPGEPSGSGPCVYLCANFPQCQWNDFICDTFLPKVMCEINI